MSHDQNDPHSGKVIADMAAMIAQVAKPAEWQRHLIEALSGAAGGLRTELTFALKRAGLTRPMDAQTCNRPEGVTAEDDMAQLRAILNSTRDWNDGHGVVVPTAMADAFARMGLVEGYVGISDLPLISGLPEGVPQSESPIWRHPDPADQRPPKPMPNRAARRRQNAGKNSR
jgi:hypothetical protein